MIGPTLPAPVVLAASAGSTGTAVPTLPPPSVAAAEQPAGPTTRPSDPGDRPFGTGPPGAGRWRPFIGLAAGLAITIAVIVAVVLTTRGADPTRDTGAATTAGPRSDAVQGDGPDAAVLPPSPATAPDVERASSSAVATTAPAAAPADADPTAATVATVTQPDQVTATGAQATVAGRGDVVLDIRFEGSGNEEWIRLTHTGTQELDLTGWTLSDDGLRNLYRFRGVRLGAGEAVSVFSGCGDDTRSAVFWCASDDDVWDDGGDVATLVDGRGRLVSTTGRN